MLTEYIEAGLRHASCSWLAEDGGFFCEIPELPGVWSTGATEAEARAELREVLEGWLALGLSLGHPLPIIDGVEIVVQPMP